jgi:nicotinamide-nucleotide amidase
MNASEILEALERQGRKLIFAESLTGGLLVDAFVSVPGASDVVLGSEVTYASELKVALLGVDEATLEKHGAVSAEVATQMAQGVCAVGQASADLEGGKVLSVATTGNAGPDGDPVGLVFVAVYDGRKTKVREFRFAGSRQEIREQAVQAAIELLGEQINS